MPGEAQAYRPDHRPRTSEERMLINLGHQIVRPNVIERANVGMIQRGNGTGFLLKTYGPKDLAHAMNVTTV
ncbi:MAG TPA: hypothetical protein VKS20_05355 [Candidatus Acidoferrales bacterium]|nr:hypothetical protein [Candidatus Acidoferrales bacterium]